MRTTAIESAPSRMKCQTPISARRSEEVEPATAKALRILREEKRCAVLDVWLPAL
ncbi:MAG TPA: hypothetical protein VMT54_19080 [Candidatus Cybelea sp.]|nr:hypothetical protein [Candidatus Cybelea sp.]